MPLHKNARPEGAQNKMPEYTCGMPGVCHCEEDLCTLEEYCFCPVGYTKKELPNTGGVGGAAVCYGCRLEVGNSPTPRRPSADADFDDDDDVDLEDIFDGIDADDDNDVNPDEIDDANSPVMRKCGAPGICNCEEYRCTIESTCVCPLDMVKLDLPNTGSIGGDVCYGCRHQSVSIGPPQLDYDDDDDLEGDKIDIFADEKVDFEADFDDDDDLIDDDIFGDDADNEDLFSEAEEEDIDEVTSSFEHKCGSPGICDCQDFRCTIESTCTCPLGMVRLELPNTGSIGGDICYGCRNPEEAKNMDQVTEKEFALPIWVALILFALVFAILFRWIAKLHESQKRPRRKKRKPSRGKHKKRR